MTHPFNKMNQWVGSPVDYRTGDRAIEALKETNDNKYWDDTLGSILVDQERWEQAQEYEHATWMAHGLGSREDRDHQHTAMFDNYKSLPQHLGRLIEFGCGPFTQTYNAINTSTPSRTVESITLVDPLIDQYKNHPHCRYSNLPSIEATINSPAEDFTGTGYDTAICINVLEHVRDATKVMENITGSLKQGGTLIFHDRVYDGLDITKIYDIGHPIRITTKFLEPFISQFTPKHVRDDYFIGVKK